MLEKIIHFFVKRHILTNLVLFVVFIGGVFAWRNTNKEELPAFTFDRVRVSVRYPGASADDVEYFVTKPIEEELRGIDGIYRITSTSSEGQTSISVEIEQNYPNIEEVITEIRNAVLDVDLPEEVIDDPRVRVFKTSKKAILDIALYNKDIHLLDVPGRKDLQSYALALENQLLNLSEVHSINKRGYLAEEIQIRVYPEKLQKYEIPFNTVMSEIRNNHVRKPAGTLKTEKEPKVTLLSELNTVEKLKKLAIQGGFEGQMIRLEEVAEVENDFEKNDSVFKVNGHEAIMFSVVKNSSYGILESIDAVSRVANRYRANNLSDTPIKLVLLDDESIDVRNRLHIISVNGVIGFILIVISLFIFLNKQAGLFVAMGIPFTFCFTMVVGSAMGYTINGTTLAAVIIVMGMVVDDAIVVSENITRLSRTGMDQNTAVIKGTAYVMLPVFASILTTCIAFIPLFYFRGHFGALARFIPPIIFLMLGASLIESLFILPGHMSLRMLPFRKKAKSDPRSTGSAAGHWFDKIENKYARLLERILPLKWLVFGVFIILLVLSGLIVTNKMKFVMFPFEETRDISINGETEKGMTRYETAKKVREIEDAFIPYLEKEVVGIRTQIAHSRRGSAVEENYFRILVEIVPKEKREKSADQLIVEFENAVKSLEGFYDVKFQKSRWGHSSGSPIELIIQQNNDEIREKIAQELSGKMKEHPALDNVEIDERYKIPEYIIDIDRDAIKRLAISPADVASTFRAALEGTVLYDFPGDDEEIRVRITTVDSAKDDIERVLDIPVENKRDYLVPLRNIVHVRKVVSPLVISRRDLKRTTIIDADMSRTTKMTPVEIAEDIEKNVFPAILKEYPTTQLSFGGEVQDTRESKDDFKNAVIMVLVLIYLVLAVLFNSLTKPIIIMLTIPFGIVGIILAFYFHGKSLYGFFACIGALGLAGVVVNDAIIMLTKLSDEYDASRKDKNVYNQISTIASTRLRAVMLTTLTTAVGVMPTAYGLAGYDAMLAEMMLALAWGLIFGTLITLVLVPCVFSIGKKRTAFI